MMDPHQIPQPDRQGLRSFGLVTGGIFAALFGLFFPWLLDLATPIWPFAVGGVLGGLGLLAPMTLKSVYHWWMRFALALSKITTPIILGIVYYLMFLPTGLLIRLFGRDPMARRIDPSAGTYRVPSRRAPPENMERPF